MEVLFTLMLIVTISLGQDIRFKQMAIHSIVKTISRKKISWEDLVDISISKLQKKVTRTSSPTVQKFKPGVVTARTMVMVDLVVSCTSMAVMIWVCKTLESKVDMVTRVWHGDLKDMELTQLPEHAIGANLMHF